MVTLLLAVLIIVCLPLIMEVAITMTPYVVIGAVVVLCVVVWPLGVGVGLVAIAGHVAGLKRVQAVIENERFKSAFRLLVAVCVGYLMLVYKHN